MLDFKPKVYEVSGRISDIIPLFLINSMKMVVLNGHVSTYFCINANVSKGLLFDIRILLIFMNQCHHSHVGTYVEETLRKIT